MLQIKLQNVGASMVLIEKSILMNLIQKVQEIEDIKLEESFDDIPTDGIMKLAEMGKSFDFLYDEKEDVYSVADIKVPYK